MQKISYEDAMNKLEEIVERLEKGDISLEKSVELFTDGMKYFKICSNYLDQAEGKIKVLLQDDNIQDLTWSKEEE